MEAPESLALAFATIERPHVAQRLISSVRQRFPAMPIYVADQSLDIAAMSSFYAHMRVTVIRMPYDAGVCASRNRLAASIVEQYFVLCDDDFVFGSGTDFREALRILHNHPDIGVVGGRLYDFDGNSEYQRNWELYLHLDVDNRTLTSTPIYQYAPRIREMGSTRLFLCDAVMNFAVMRRAIFDQPAIRWDERFKSNGEHEDFFLNLKLNSSVRVAYLPTMIAYHHHPEAFANYRSQLRDRLEGWRRLFEKWGIDQYLEIGLGVRSIDDLRETVNESDARSRFYLNDHLSLRRQAESESLLVDKTRLAGVGLLDGTGEAKSSPRMARLLVPLAGGKVMTGPEIEPFEEPYPGTERVGSGNALARYSLEPMGAAVDIKRGSVAILFRYNSLTRADSDFVLWYRVCPEEGKSWRASSGTMTINLRWFAADGSVLVWESSPYLLDIRRSDFWAPLLVEVPVCPRHCAWMRFEVVAGGPATRHPLANGFLFSAGSAISAESQQAPAAALDVLAFSAWKYAATALPPAAVDLSDLAMNGAASEITAEFCAHVPSLMLLETAGLRDSATVLVYGWPGLGAPLSMIPCDGMSGVRSLAPKCVAMPREAADCVQLAIFIKGEGYHKVTLRRE
jgi:glycosyltransferase involved in cell wall biosynthesis